MTSSMTRGVRLTAAVLLGISAVASLSCGGDDGGPSGPSITNFITKVQTGGGALVGVRHGGDAPVEGAGPAASVAGAGSVINGGSAQIQVSAPANFSTVYVTVVGYKGYYSIDLPAAVSDIPLVFTLGRNIPDPDFAIDVAVAEGGATGVYAAHSVTVIDAGAGQVQISVAWTGASDVDLHVVEPGGEEIFYNHTVSATNGALDLDSNADCVIDNVNNENVTWATNAPNGSYIVRLDYYKSCGVAQSDYVVTVQREGAQPQTFQGSFTGGGDLGGAGSGLEVTTFTH